MELQNLQQCLLMRICLILSFPVSFPCFSMLHLQVPQGEISQLWDGSRVGFFCPLGPAEHRAGQEGEQMDAGAALMLLLPAVGTGFSSWGWAGQEGLSVCLCVCLSWAHRSRLLLSSPSLG